MAETVPSKKGWVDRIDEPVHTSDDVDVGDITGTPPNKPPNNKAVDRDRPSKLANLLEGLEFPATKEEIRNHLNRRSPAMDNTVNDVIEVINNLDDRREYGSVYDVEMAAGLVEQAGSKKPYVRDRVHRKRIGQKAKPDPYIGRERIWPANARDVSPNTPKGEDV